MRHSFGSQSADNLSIGLNIPYYWYKSHVKKAELDTTQATVGKNPTLNTLTPLSVPGTVPLTTQDAQNLIGKGLDINGDGKIDIPGYGYKPIRSVTVSDFGDIEAGLRYRYLKTDNWGLAVTGGVRFPTGQEDDPDNLIDVPTSSDTYGLFAELNNSYTGIKNLTLTAELRYDWFFSNQQVKRVPADVHQPITPNKENVEIHRGGIFKFEGAGTYSFTESVAAQLKYEYAWKAKNNVSGNMGFNYQSLEDETDYRYQLIGVQLSYSTIPLFMAKRFSVPINASIGYETIFAGKNFLKQDYLALRLSVFF